MPGRLSRAWSAPFSARSFSIAARTTSGSPQLSSTSPSGRLPRPVPRLRVTRVMPGHDSPRLSRCVTRPAMHDFPTQRICSRSATARIVSWARIPRGGAFPSVRRRLQPYGRRSGRGRCREICDVALVNRRAFIESLFSGYAKCRRHTRIENPFAWEDPAGPLRMMRHRGQRFVGWCPPSRQRHTSLCECVVGKRLHDVSCWPQRSE